MDREILFRGKRADNGEWVEGGILQTENWASIFVCKDCQGSLNEAPYSDVEEFDVIPKTVGQYTGLTDKNGKKIFEGDILHENYHSENDVVIVWDDGSFRFKCLHDNFCNVAGALKALCFNKKSVEKLKAIGNIHDNPDLLEVSE